MPASTPNLGLPYPLPTDQVSEGAADIQALAEAIDPILAGSVDAPGTAQRWRLYGGTVGPFAIAAGDTIRKNAIYPAAFSAAPAVLVSIEATNDTGANTDPGKAPAYVWIYTSSPAMAEFYVRNASNGGETCVVHWLAFGLTGGVPGLLPGPDPEPEPT